jgi:hypothetical protein
VNKIVELIDFLEIDTEKLTKTTRGLIETAETNKIFQSCHLSVGK